MAGHMGNDRVTVKKLTIVRADAERNVLLVKGPLPGARERARPRQEGLSDAHARRSTPRPARRPARSTCPRRSSRRRSTRPCMHQAVTAQLAGAPHRHGRHQDARRGPRRRRQAVPPEGHRPGPPGLAPRAALRGRRRGLRAAPALYEQRLPKRMKRLALHGALTSKFDDGAIKVVEDLGLDADQDARCWSATSTRSRPPAASSSSPPGRTRTSSCRRATCPA